MAAPNRYSTLIAWTKVALPLIALALLSTLFLFSRTPNPEDALPFAAVDVEQLAREQRLSRPRFAGTMEDGREVTLVAETAAPATTNPNLILLTEVETRVTLGAGDRLTLTAATGDIDLAAQRVDLAGTVDAATTAGFALRSERVTVAMDTMRLAAPGPVVLTGPGMTLEAGAMEITGPEGQAFLSFTGGVRLLYQPGDQ
ncbi:LPS export ABC transporter periplasmic protein LptC [Roseicyclus persicicus]|uniref:LPS export ABC transporter periplasmic protein LptC n=1 Tax=Roseicyclus persicicus TaxID=2650661 RepID=A0A7X6GZ86_9RHOB|nr:LPS export ABC transporter periplasmic protein LptC [Roseibacterium persicicum]NKX45126.1 LPS export ABC transporter periplasmic protein LptC [Roseibacterium persicicum]